MVSEEREQKLKERLLASFELARTAKLKPKVAEAQKSKNWFSGLIDQKVELVSKHSQDVLLTGRWLGTHKSFSRISPFDILTMSLLMYLPPPPSGLLLKIAKIRSRNILEEL
jgi:hypothetical protein